MLVDHALPPAWPPSLLMRVFGLAFMLAGCASGAQIGAAAPPVPARTAAAESTARYNVAFASGGELSIEVQVPAGVLSQATIESGAEDFVSHIEVASDGSAFTAIAAPSWPLRLQGCARPCSVRYRFDLAAAAREFKNPQFAAAIGGGFLAPPTTWLLRPTEARSLPFVLSVATPAGSRFFSGLARDEQGRFHASLADLSQAPYSGFGPFGSQVVHVGAATVEVVRVGPEPAVGDTAVVGWVTRCASDIAATLGEFPQKYTLVLVVVGGGQSIANGSALGNGGASVIVHLGADAQPSRFADDWILTHELVHVSMPGLARKHSWMEEGMATFLEPIARANAGRLSARDVWAEWYYAMAQGQPLSGDGGLDGTRSWGRLYWGGAAFWLLAEVAIAEKTNGAKGVRHCLRNVNLEGGTIASRWSIERFLGACDRGVGHAVVEPIYRELAERAVPFDLDGLFSKLGVKKASKGVELDDAAAGAPIRRAMFGP